MKLVQGPLWATDLALELCALQLCPTLLLALSLLFLQGE